MTGKTTSRARDEIRERRESERIGEEYTA